MSIHDTIDELGPLTVAREIIEFSHTCDETTASRLLSEQSGLLPIPDLYQATRKIGLVDRIAAMIDRAKTITSKSTIIVAGAELVLLEALARESYDGDVVVAVDGRLAVSVLDRIAANVPGRLSTRVLPLPGVPAELHPSRVVLVTLGLSGGMGMYIVPSRNVPVIEWYSTLYHGERLLLDPVGSDTQWRSPTWKTTSRNTLFTNTITTTEEMS